MRTKRKMALAISAFVMLILAGVVSVVAVLAAQNVTLKSSVKVTFTAGANVMGAVTARYKTEKGTLVTIFNGNSASTGAFSGSETGNSETPHTITGEADDVSLNADGSSYIEYIFTFTNDSTVADYTATLALTGTTKNENTNIYIQGPGDTGYTLLTNPTLTGLMSFNIAKKTTTAKTVKLKVEVKSNLADFEFSGDLQWSLVADR